MPAKDQVRMLGNFDTYLLGWKDRGFAVTGEHAATSRRGGRLDPAGDRRGRRRVGGWRSSRKSGRLEIALNLPRGERVRLGSKIDAEIRDIERFEGMPVGGG